MDQHTGDCAVANVCPGIPIPHRDFVVTAINPDDERRLFGQRIRGRAGGWAVLVGVRRRDSGTLQQLLHGVCPDEAADGSVSGKLTLDGIRRVPQ
jgi:hypothetical protein